MLVLLDSTVLIDYLRGRPAVARVQRLETLGDAVCTTESTSRRCTEVFVRKKPIGRMLWSRGW